MLSIHLRPPKVEDHQFPAHWEGDLIKGAGVTPARGRHLGGADQPLADVSYVPHPLPASASNLLQAFTMKGISTDKLNSIAQQMRLSMTYETYDQASEMVLHQQLTAKPAVYFCDPHSPFSSAVPIKTDWPDPPAFAQGHRSFRLHPVTVGCDCR
jgi:transposase, IS30 family